MTWRFLRVLTLRRKHVMPYPKVESAVIGVATSTSSDISGQVESYAMVARGGVADSWAEHTSPVASGASLPG